MSLFGFRRTSRAAFLDLWRAARAVTLARPGELRGGCGDVRGLLEGGIVEDASLDGAPPEAAASSAAPSLASVAAASVTSQAGAASASSSTSSSASPAPPKPAPQRAPKPAVVVAGLPGGVSADAVATALEAAGCGVVLRAISAPAGVVVVFARATGAAAALALHGTAVAVATAPLGPVSAILSVRPAPERARKLNCFFN